MTEQTTVPFIQMSDLNDGDILNQTRKMAVGNGVQLEYTLPSGQVLKSDVLQQDQIRGSAMISWIEAVKSRIVEDAQSVADEALRKARTAQMTGPSLDQFIPKEQPSDAQLRAAGVPEVWPRAPGEPPVADARSPKQYAQAKVKELKGTTRMLRQMIKQRRGSLNDAEKALAEWEKVVAGLTGKRARSAA